MVVLFCAFRFSRRLSYALTPLILSICVATVYGRYHYALDVLAGMLMAGFGCWLIRTLEKKKAGARGKRASGADAALSFRHSRG